MLRRVRFWIVLVVVLLVVLTGALLLALPSLVRWAAVTGIHSATGRPTTLGAVEVNLFTGRLAMRDLRVADLGSGPPLAELERLEARFHLLPLVVGRLRLDAVTVAAPRIHLVREASGRLNISDILDGLGKGKPSSEPADVVLTRLDLERGAVTFEDRAVTPTRTWDAANITLGIRDIATRSKEARGSVTARLMVAGAPVTLEASEIRVAPARAKATLTLTSLDLAPLWAYVPGDPPVAPQGGRFTTRLVVDYAAETGVRAGGEVDLASLALLRRGQSQPLVFTPLLHMTSRDVVYKDGDVTAGRLELMGDPSIVDASVSPPQRFDLRGFHVIVEDASYPTRAPARVTVTSGLPAAGTLEVRGTADLHPVAANLDIVATNVDLTLARAYLPPTVPITLGGGRLAATLKTAYAADGTLRASGDVSVAQLALFQRDHAQPLVTLPLLKTAIGEAMLHDGAFSLRRLEVRGAPTIVDDSVTPARRLALRGLSLETTGIAWPPGPPARVRLGVDLPDTGAVGVSGTIGLATRALDLVVELKDTSLAPYRPWLPIDAELSGRADGRLTVRGGVGEGQTLLVKGSLGASAVSLGSGSNAPVSLERAAVTGLEVQWPSRVLVERVVLTKPHLLVERQPDGAFPLRAMLAPRAAPEPSASTADRPAADRPAPPARPSAAAPMAIEIREFVIEDGDTRFVDRSTTPFFSEEISRLALTMRGFRNAPDSRADLSVHAVVGPRGALELHGQVAALGEPFYLDLDGELRDIAITEANPYMRFYSGWVARTGSVTTKLHYRVVGDELEAANDVHVQTIHVERAPGDDASVGKRVALPLGLIVAMITDSRGDIQFQVPVTGKLNAPGFSIGDAIWSAIKNVLVNVAAAPFRAIGKLFSRGKDESEQFQVDPVPFEAGSADLTADAQGQLQRVADFLRASPYVKMAVEPVVSAGDVAALKTQAVVARVQLVQRERKLADFGAAAAAVFSEAIPETPVPENTDQAIAALREREPVPDEAVRDLAARRAEAARKALVESAGIEPARLEERPAPASMPDAVAGRVQFELLP
jgi:uncharacterized protein DUF748